MFEKYKARQCQKDLKQALEEMYNPLFEFRKTLKLSEDQLVEIIGEFELVINDLLKAEGKDEATLIRERWQASQFSVALEQHRNVLLQLREFLGHVPEEPEPPQEYEISLFGFDDDDHNG